ncbi:uncharacterized protein K489DRAFT_388144 [Dissoconium aciculare CBS 342.82]|uniref:5-nitroimidazole antibiotic resistance protein n=1 Tax=Dissoconium aciculare CBS 342.82 TaxID=1314786 RepID=A0A6J3M8X3_9PEZI|nr:uncharacterized protein K489DRAFT_388144 [Dissoconium aciculare CBS 342.82]KAF1823287.1 hypothetical protein K489DRAFT_388144 [Dissoconium aciculare CBS 342.82]
MTSSTNSEEFYGSGSHAKSQLNTVKRYPGRGKYDYQQVYPIVDQAPILHVAFQPSTNDEGPTFPVILPMLGCMGSFGSSAAIESVSPPDLYLHGYVSARMMRLSRSATAEDPSGMPVCVSATLMDGIVLALTPNHHSCNYRSAVIFGHASIVDDEAERLFAMELITNNLVPERWQHTRYPNGAELKSTGILKVTIHSASAKVRTGSTGEAREDLKNEEMRKTVWSGVVPSRTVYDEPIPASTNMHKGTPPYIAQWVEDFNAVGKIYAAQAGRPVN